MNNPIKALARSTLLIVAMLLMPQAAYAAVAGHVQFVNGNVQITSAAGKTSQAQKGDAVSEGDTLTSASSSSAQIKMQDGGFVAVRADTKMKFDQFVFAGKQDGSEKSFFSLFKGGFRAVTGLIGMVNKQNYRITTPASTIGIRGTDHETFMITPDNPLAQVAPTGAYSKVNIGETTMTTDKGTINVLPNQMGFAAGMNQVPQLQPVNTNIFTVAAAPTAEIKVEQKEEKKESGESKQDQAAKSEGGEESEQSDAPVRESAVADEVFAAELVGSVDTPVVDEVFAAELGSVDTWDEAALAWVDEPVPVTLAADGQIINLNNQTIATAGGTATALTTTTVAPAGTVAAYVQTDLAAAFAMASSDYLKPFTQIDSLLAKPADLNNALPNPFFINRYAGKDPASYITNTLNGTTTVGQAASTIAATGIQFGRYNSTQVAKLVVGNTNCCAAGTYPSLAGVFSHWIVGPAVDPVYLPEVLIATNAVYTLAGATVPTTAFSGGPTLTSATLSVNFAQQLVSLNLALAVGAAPWTASTVTPLEMMYWNNAKVGFRATTVASPGWGTLVVTGATSGYVTGQLTGSGLNGAILSYVLSGGSDQVAGVVAFTGTAQNAATPYRIAGLSGIDWNPPANVSNAPVPGTLGGYTNAGTVLVDAAGNVTQFNASQPFTSGAGITLGIGTATVAGLGTDPVSGISWGRWVGGTLSKTDLATNTITNLQNTTGAGGAGAALSSHWIASPTLVGPVTLPVTGVFNYVLAGGTAPTDSMGGIGTLNSASLSANFAAQTMSIGLNVTTPNAGNLIASAANLPIEQNSMFNASTAGAAQGGNPGSLTLTGSVAGTPQGHIGGAFVGAGGIGAAMVYGLVSGNGVIVNGVTAFHR